MAATVTIDLSAKLDQLEARLKRHNDAADQIVAKVTDEDRNFTKDEEDALKVEQTGIVATRKLMDSVRERINARGEPGESRTQPKDKAPSDRPAGPGRGALDDEDDEDLEQRRKDRQHRKVFRLWLQRGVAGLTEQQRSIMQSHYTDLTGPEARDLSALVGQAGGYTVPQGFISDIEVAMKAFNSVLAAPITKLDTDTGADLPWPTVNDTVNEGELIGENTAITQVEPTFGQITFKAYIYSSKLILIPITLMQDSGINLDGLLSRLVSERLGRITGRHMTVGTGANMPQGIVTGSTLGKTAAAAAAITYDEIVDLQHSVDPAYRNRTSGFMFHDLVQAALRKLKDADGRPIWQPAMVSGMADGAPGTLLGSPYWINMFMDTLATGNKTMLFGDMSKYVRRLVKSMTIVRLTERYAEKLQVGFFAFMRLDGRVLDAGTHPLKYLQQA